MSSTPTPERWQAIRRVLDAALDLSPVERPPYLDAACACDAALRREVESLIAADAGDAGLLGSRDGAAPLGALARAAVDAPAATSWAGRRVGPYTIVGEIGRGGMGAVYRAERADVGLTVALKVVAGGLAAPERAERFLLERRVLARLEHPNIARLLDAGVLDDGTPWLAMEYVRGESLDRWCDGRRLGIADRLALVERVCEAVAYAHRALVVHRDIKPANVLVDADGAPRLLDFGIAKLLDEADEGLTGTGVRLLTPGYAAPEQLTGDAVTVASDVYALGVVLYELLCGRRPYHSGGRTPTELGRFLREHPLPPPSAALAREGDAPDVSPAELARARGAEPEPLRRALAGDLDAIVMRALAVEPERRYPSVEALLDDLRRWRQGLPVRARPDSRGYRARKFVSRHRVGVAATALLVLALAGVAVTMTLEQARTARALERARLEAAKSDEVTRFVSGLFAAGNPYEAGGDTITVRGVLQRGVARVDELRAEPEVQARLLGVIGRAYNQLGQPRAALPLHRRALATFRRLQPGGGPELATAMFDLANDFSEARQYDSALTLHTAALDMRRRLLGARHIDVAASLTRRAVAHVSRSEYAAAERDLREALAIHRALARPDSTAMAGTLNNLAVALYTQGRYAGGDSLFRELIALRRAAFGPRHPLTAVAIGNLGIGYADQDRGRDAEPLLREALAIIAGTALPPWHQGVISPLTGLARAVGQQGRYVEADSLFRQLIALRRARGGDTWGSVGMTLVWYADVQRERGGYRAADSLLRLADSAITANSPPTHANVGEVALGRAMLLVAEGRAAEAEPLARRALAILQDRRGAGHPRTIDAMRVLGQALAARGRPDEAAPLLRAAYEGARTTRGADDPRTRAARAALDSLRRPPPAARQD